MKYDELSTIIIKNIGGKENVLDLWHCVTRLRFTVKDKSEINIDTLKNTPGIMGAQFSGDQFQIIIGNDVADVFEIIQSKLNLPSGNNTNKVEKEDGIFARTLDVITSIFTPILPALAGTGLLKGFLTLFVAIGWMSEKSGTYQVLYILSDCVFYFLPFLLAVSAAKKFKTSEYLSLALAGVLLYPTIINAAVQIGNGNSVAPIKFLGSIVVPYVKYNNSVIPIILTVWLFSYIYRWIKQWMPKVLSFMFSPMLAFLIVVPLELIVLGPLGEYVGDLMAGGLTWLYVTVGPIAGFIFGALYPLMILTGMHHALAPVAMNSIATVGYDKMIIPINLVSNIAQSGAAFGVAIKTKNKTIRQLAWSSGVSALFGITEPAMYGVNMRLKKPFYYCLVSSGLSGAIIGYFGIKCFAMGVPGLPFLTAFVDRNNVMNIVWMGIATVLSFILAFLMTVIIGFADEKDSENDGFKMNRSSIKLDQEVNAPVSGELIQLNQVTDPTFSTGIMGKGIAIIPSDTKIFAPINGTISVLPEDSKHAIGIVSEGGIEVLIHIGIDTVELKGVGFNPRVKIGDSVQKGDVLEIVDFDSITKAGYETTVIVVITNSEKFTSIQPVTSKAIRSNENAIRVLN